MMWILILIATLAIVMFLVATEIYARLVLGLGNPPLWRFDEEYEYILKANQHCRRLGNEIRINQWSMRSRDNTAKKKIPNELRVLVLGDSIVNGVPRIAHDQLATTLLEQHLAEKLKRPVWVGNISAGSWGPPNLIGYVKRHGLFDADVCIIVVNSSDYFKELQFKPLDIGRPERRPIMAIEEIFNNYIRRRIRRKLRKKQRLATQAARTGEQSTAAMNELILLFKHNGSKIIVLQHLGRFEIQGKPQSGYQELCDITTSCGVIPVSLAPMFAAALDRGDEPYEDDLHPNRCGQEIIAQVMFAEICDVLDDSQD